MAFFLLGRSVDDGLALLSTQAFDSRQDALAELGKITADPGFGRWDDEVMLIDLETGTPVLLVRPATAVDEPAAETEPEAVAEPDAESQPETEPSEPPAADVELAASSTEPPEDQPAQMDALRAALARTTEHMEASGITAPESIGPAEVKPVAEEPAEETEPEPSPEPSSEAEAEPEAESVSEVAPEDAAELEPEPEPEPEPEVAPELAPEPEPEIVAVSPEPSAPAWPWDTTAAETPATEPEYVLHALEEPAIDAGGSLITSAADDEMLAVARPVILGSYEKPAESTAEVAAEPTGDAATPATEADVTEPSAESAEPQLVGGATHDTESDFILLDPIPADPASAAPEGGAEVAPLSSYTCTDCIYVDTCPNKDQRRPEDCGSFQWK